MNNKSKDLDYLRTPPHSIEAEQSVLGGLFIDNSTWDKVSDVIKEEDFYKNEHKIIWKHIEKLISADRPVDIITINDSLLNSGKSEDVGGIEYLNALAHNTPSAANIRRYAEIVRERAILRKLISISEEISENALNTKGKDAKQILDEAEAKVFRIAQDRISNFIGFQEIQPLLSQVVERIDELYSRDSNSDITGVPTGFIDLDKMTSGLQPGDLIVVAGRPSMGKTAFSMNIGEYVSIEHGLPVAIFSMEMSATQLAMRMLGSIGVIDQHKIRTGRLTEEDWPKITNAIQSMQDAQLYIDESPALNVMEVRAKTRRLSRQCGQLGLIIIDYMQLMSGNGEENRATEISEISRSLKGLAKELNCPLIALSQLNRSLEQRQNKRPVMSDLRESGAIEQDADLILFIYRDEIYNPDSQEKGIAEIIIGKQRNGPIGTIKLTFQGPTTRFLNFANTSSI
ncbi:replicative DNA helicase [Candidatus Kinetoplastidibacterium crithidiae]|uniref:Replicative DNA helicase n=1 Tax=Candidatus Kinetoplastidibacterium crithidiae TCC036E TaxID=1208918 RepID=M1L4N6_9PROT|nr:replicative DNA helicase [Candidatus Kinetoplastibacterium crithidii]AFZ82686.1 replicative DNA helicase [Candidatus Kinetoplastibacterium crithidii (ex Angomonas deanei ATCC 30255)]AGF47658.1 replicative DNA helicase [Candidatus Kinetoplastibacterium crithidii TCC036E]